MCAHAKKLQKNGQLPLIVLALAFLIVGIGCEAPPGDGEPEATAENVEYVDSDSQTGTSALAVVSEEAPLAHTTQFLPFDENGELVGNGGVAAQTRQVLDNLESALGEADADLNSLVKVNVYATGTEVIDSVKQVFGETFSEGAQPTVTYVETELPHSEAVVAMDAVAVSTAGTADNGSETFRTASLYGEENTGHVTILPPGDRVYIAGQAEQGESVVEATTATMEGLHETLEFLGLDASDVVQVKGFMHGPMSEADAVREEIASFYPERLSPSIVLTEWEHDSFPIEIEMIAAADTSVAPDTTAISYITPPWMSSSDVFSRVAQVHRGDPVYISGLYGDPGKDAAGQIRDIFTRMDTLLSEANSDFRHLAKATYYTTTGEASSALGEIRPEFYDPERPPAASLSPAPGIGKEGAVITIDMIGVSAP